MFKITSRIMALLSSIWGVLVITVAAILLEDIVENRSSQFHRPLREEHVEGNYDRYVNTFRLDEDAFLILLPMVMVIGLFQILFSFLTCYGPVGQRKKLQLWAGGYSSLLFLALCCFIISLTYKIDERKSFKINDNFVGSSRYSSPYIWGYTNYYGDTYSPYEYASWWKYAKAQTYLAILGLDLFVFITVLVYIAMQLCTLPPEADEDARSEIKYHLQQQSQLIRSRSPSPARVRIVTPTTPASPRVGQGHPVWKSSPRQIRASNSRRGSPGPIRTSTPTPRPYRPVTPTSSIRKV